VYGKDRHEAIARMREALNAFVIRGISSNIAFQSALLAHPKFVAGDFNTGFIAEQYPKGFSTAAVPHDSPTFLLALAAAAHYRMRARAAGISGQLPGHEVQIGEDFVVVLTDEEGQRQQTAVTARSGADGVCHVHIGAHEYPIHFSGSLRELVAHGDLAGEPFCVQIERVGLSYHISHNGAQVRARVLSPRAAELNALMPFKAPPDLSKFLLSPMPGLLVEVAVAAGQQVRAGEKLAVIEAMKMENILIATQDCVVSEVAATKGESLAVDQVILKFH
jgi:propionyl-CoA carboxylase alpha chain